MFKFNFNGDSKKEWCKKIVEGLDFEAKNGRRPSENSEDPKERDLAKWCDKQVENGCITFLSEDGVEEHKKEWMKNFNEVKNFIKKHHRLPLETVDEERKLAKWYLENEEEYKKEETLG